ncbi:MAG: hypothetical protein FJ104_04670 [Deltaproteobacteria bacterium]|nr:hypothetical protein [Deltaproteobacteria bacterium]
MKTIIRRTAALGTIVLGGLSLSACDQAKALSEGVCGPCGDVATGDFSVSGDARLDGFFQAVGSLQNATASVKGDFAANINALASVYGVAKATGEVDAAFVDSVIAAIKADVAANAQGGLKVVYKAPSCSANVNVAVSAQAKCEVKAGCDVQVDPGEVSVKCEGSCSGGCSGGCSGSLSCAVKAPTLNCEGSCEGTCELSAAATCEGTCRGTCNGTCSAQDGQGNCAGKCDGTCEGNCELTGKAECKGTCNGTCFVEQGSAQCTGEVECSGSCDAECSGGCKGKATPPSASASCEASADCEAQASANASASMECTPPSLDVQFDFQADVDASAQAQFLARIGEFKARGAAILQGAAKLEVLVTGKMDGEVVFAVSPVQQIVGSIEGFANADAIAKFDIPEGRLACVIPAFETAISALGSVATETAGTIAAQGKFVAYATTGG